MTNITARHDRQQWAAPGGARSSAASDVCKSRVACCSTSAAGPCPPPTRSHATMPALQLVQMPSSISASGGMSLLGCSSCIMCTSGVCADTLPQKFMKSSGLQAGGWGGQRTCFSACGVASSLSCGAWRLPCHSAVCFCAPTCIDVPCPESTPGANSTAAALPPPAPLPTPGPSPPASVAVHLTQRVVVQLRLAQVGNVHSAGAGAAVVRACLRHLCGGEAAQTGLGQNRTFGAQVSRSREPGNLTVKESKHNVARVSRCRAIVKPTATLLRLRKHPPGSCRF